MARELKVYGYTGFYPKDFVDRMRNTSLAVATTTKKAAAEALGLNMSQFRDYAGETFNDASIAAAMEEPGRVVFQDNVNFTPRQEVYRDYETWEIVHGPTHTYED